MKFIKKTYNFSDSSSQDFQGGFPGFSFQFGWLVMLVERLLHSSSVFSFVKEKTLLMLISDWKCQKHEIVSHPNVFFLVLYLMKINKSNRDLVSFLLTKKTRAGEKKMQYFASHLSILILKCGIWTYRVVNNKACKIYWNPCKKYLINQNVYAIVLHQ